MKNANMKKWLLSLAIASVAATGYADSINKNQSIESSSSTSTSATSNSAADGSNRNRIEEQNSVTESTTQRETYTNTESQRSANASGDQSAISQEETVQFETNSLALTDESEDKLENLVQNLDKSKPVAVTVEVQEPVATSSSSYREPATSDPAVSSSEPGMKDSSTGYPTDPSVTDSTMTPANPSSTMDSSVDPQREARERNTQALSQYRAESVRQFLEEKGLDVVEWNVEGSGQKQTISVTEDNGQPIEDVQQIRIVISGEAGREGLSAL